MKYYIWGISFSQWKVNCKCFIISQYKLVYWKLFSSEL